MDGDIGEDVEFKGRKRNYLKIIVIVLLFILAIPVGFYVKGWRDRSYPDYYLKFQRPGSEYLKKREWEKAAGEFKEAVKYRPDKFETHYGLALAYLKLRNLESAIEEFKKAININPENMDAHYSLGVAYQRAGMLEPAMKEYSTVIKAIPNSYQVFNNVGRIHFDMGDYDKAIEALNRAIKIKPDHYQAYLNIGQVYEARGEKGLARREYLRVRKMAAERPETMPYVKKAEERLARLNRSQVKQEVDEAHR